MSACKEKSYLRWLIRRFTKGEAKGGSACDFVTFGSHFVRDGEENGLNLVVEMYPMAIDTTRLFRDKLDCLKSESMTSDVKWSESREKGLHSLPVSSAIP